MTIHHRYSLLSHADGRATKFAAAEELWKLASHRKAASFWITGAVLILFLVFMPSFSNEPTISFRSEERRVAFFPSNQTTTAPSPPPKPSAVIDFLVGGCNIWKGDWIPHPDGPAYTNATCRYIQENQNCIKLGKPEQEYLHWRWKPHDCELPLFDANAFLRIVAGKKMGFIGDSLARNSFQSVLCHLSQVEEPECIFKDVAGGNMHWYFRSYNFTFAVVWAPFFVKGHESSEAFGTTVAQLHLDMVDEGWGPWVNNYDYVVLSGGRWFERTSVYYVQNKIMGCTFCPMINATDVGFAYAYGVALRTVFDFLISSNYTGMVFFRTFSPEHWENGAWDQGGNCTKKFPLKSSSTALDRLSRIMYNAQIEEITKTMQKSSEYSFKMRILDTLHSALLRPDAHPGPYGHFHSSAKNDCMHWCLPGAVDAWSDMLLHVLKHMQ